MQAAPPPQMVPVLVLQSNLDADALIRGQDVAVAQVPMLTVKERDIPLDKAFHFKEQAVGRILKHAKLAASWLTEDDFYEIGRGPQFKLREGYRAVNLRVERSGDFQQDHPSRFSG